MGRTGKIAPRVIIEWKNGRDFEPEIYSLADTAEEADQLEATVRQAVARKVKKPRTQEG